MNYRFRGENGDMIMEPEAMFMDADVAHAFHPEATGAVNDQRNYYIQLVVVQSDGRVGKYTCTDEGRLFMVHHNGQQVLSAELGHPKFMAEFDHRTKGSVDYLGPDLNRVEFSFHDALNRIEVKAGRLHVCLRALQLAPI